MQIIEYESKYLEGVRDLLVELEEYIVSIDEDNLDQVGFEYREKMLDYDFEDLKKYNGKCYIAVEDNKAIGLIMGLIREWDEADYLDYKCPKTGAVTELIVSKNARSGGVGKALMEAMEGYFKSLNVEYITIEAFAYNKNAEAFYNKRGYHSRMQTLIKKVED